MLRGIVESVGYRVTGIPISLAEALASIPKEKPDFAR
jgi:hypothetical protein